MKSFENAVLRSADYDKTNPEKISPIVEKAYKRTTDIFKREAVSMDAFKQDGKGGGLYSEQEVEANKEAVRDMKKKFDLQDSIENRQKLIKATVAEGLIYRGISKYGWFPGAKAIKTCEYDDYVNGIDLMAEFGGDGQSPQNVMGLMIDVTFSGRALEKKFARIEQEIEEGHLASIKYFHSKNNPRFMGRFSDVPRVVVGMQHTLVEQLAKQWMSEYEEDEELLLNTPVQRMILEQVLAQLRAQSAYAESLGLEKVAATLHAEARLVRSIIEKKNIALGALENDVVHRQIIEAAERFGNNSAPLENESPIRSVSSGVTNSKFSPKDREHKPKLSLKK